MSTPKAKAVTEFQRVRPRKARLAADLIRGLQVEEAKRRLRFSSLKGGLMLLKTLESAVANAESLHDADRANLKVLEVRVDDGPTMKRSKPKNKGGSHPIIRRTSHFTIVVGE
jgi:large subunit ribosomal protein L22